MFTEIITKPSNPMIFLQHGPMVINYIPDLIGADKCRNTECVISILLLGMSCVHLGMLAANLGVDWTQARAFSALWNGGGNSAMTSEVR